MKCPRCGRKNRSNFYCDKCRDELMEEMQPEFGEWLRQLEVFPDEENYNH